MQNKKWIRFVESFILLPVMTMSGATANVSDIPTRKITTPTTVSSKLNMKAFGPIAFNQVIAPDAKEEALGEDKILKIRALAIDSYFKRKEMPLEGMGMKMVLEAEKNEIDWRLLPAISVRESTGGKQACIRVPNNSFGWGSCRIGFKSNDVAIETVARNLGGNNPNTARHYDNKTTLDILRSYNPPSIVPKYGEQVIAIMDTIGEIYLGE